MALWRRAWFQIHWFIGITAGSVLLVIGLSGAVLSFRAEITDLIDPALHRLPHAADARPLTPAELLDRLQAAQPGRRVATLTLFAEAGRPVRVNFAPPPGERRGETRLIDPYTAGLLPEPRAEAFFEFVESLHRWLLMPRDTGKPVTGTLAAGLLVLALSGLYLRWPRKPLAWRSWLRLDFALSGRAFLWNLHAVAGTIALLAYLVSGFTGLYWGFDAVRTVIDDAAGEGRAVRMQRMQGARPADAAAGGAPARLDLQRVWRSFQQTTLGDWSQVTLRLPTRNASQVEATYLRPAPEHERARNRLYLQAATGEATQHERYADKPMAGRLVNSIYPLHMGTYWGLPGRILMMLASLGLALFAITGWMLYLGRRRTRKALRAERAQLDLARGSAGQGPEQVLIAFATQTGHAERVALQTAAALQSAGLGIVVKTLAELSVDALLHFRKVLWVVSTSGDGEPPDSARAFARKFAQQAGSQLQHIHYGMLALGDWHYATFCGFGRKLDRDLRNQGAQALFPMVEVDNGNPEAIGRWQRSIAEAFDVRAAWPSHAASPAERAFESWRLVRRQLLNPGSLGHPLFEIELHRAGAPAWQPGALVEVLLQGAPAAADAHPRPAPRSYSVASMPADDCVQLLVRQMRHEGGLGLASGWLTAGAQIGDAIQMRLVANPAFALADEDLPCIFIGNGSGYAGLRSHLRERVRRGHARNWLVYGERQAAHDAFCAADTARWQALGMLARADLVYSRDQPERRYVQHCLREAADELRRWIADGALVYVCGSREGLAPGVDAALSEVLGAAGLDALIAQGRYRRDVY